MKLLSAVQLQIDLPEHNLTAGQVGTVVEILDAEHVLVEFADDKGVARAIVPLAVDQLQPADPPGTLLTRDHCFIEVARLAEQGKPIPVRSYGPLRHTSIWWRPPPRRAVLISQQEKPYHALPAIASFVHARAWHGSASQRAHWQWVEKRLLKRYMPAGLWPMVKRGIKKERI